MSGLIHVNTSPSRPDHKTYSPSAVKAFGTDCCCQDRSTTEAVIAAITPSRVVKNATVISNPGANMIRIAGTRDERANMNKKPAAYPTGMLNKKSLHFMRTRNAQNLYMYLKKA